MNGRLKELWKRVSGFRYAFLVGLVGAALLLWPSGIKTEAAAGTADGEEARIAALLRQIEGVGRTEILLSEHGAAVVCEGAADPSARLAVTEAVRCYTGLGAHEVVIFKLDD